MFFCVFLAGKAPAAPVTEASWKGPVLSVESESFTKADLDLISRALGITIGKPLDTKRVNAGIQALFGQGKVQTLFLEAEPSPRGVRLFVRGEKIRKIRQVHFTNIDSDLLDELKGKVNLEEGGTVTQRTFQLLQERLKSAYEARGHPQAQISFNFTDVPNTDQTDVEIKVDPNASTRVTRVEVVGGVAEENKKLRAQTVLKKGDLFSKKLLEESIDKINAYLKANQYLTSKVEDTSLHFNKDKSEVEVVITMRMNGRYLFQFSGNTVFDQVELRELLTEDVLTQSDSSQKVAERIEGKYRATGYHFCKVHSRTLEKEPQIAGSNVVRFEIKEGPKVIIDSIRFQGGLGSLSAGELEDLFLEGAPGVLHRGIYWEQGVPEALKALKAKLETMGFLTASLSTPRTIFTTDRKGADLVFDVELGTQTKVSAIQIDGAKELDAAKIKSLIGLDIGDPLNRGKLVEGRKELLNYYQTRGYSDVKYVDVGPADGAEISKDSRNAILHVQIIEGRKYFVGQITLEGMKKTRPEIIRRELKVKTGDIYDPTQIRRSEEDVSALGLFSRVEILSTVNAGDPNRKDLKVVLRESRPGVGEMGMGAAYEDPRFRVRGFGSIGYRNVSGLNQTASARAEVAVPFSTQDALVPFIEYSGTLGYRAPYPFDLPFTFSARVLFNSLEVANNGPSITLQTGTSVSGIIEKQFSSVFTGIYRLYSFSRTRTEVLYGDPNNPIDVTENIGSTGPQAIFDFRDDRYNPSKGSYHILSVEYAAPWMLSGDNFNYVMSLVRNTFYIPLFSPFKFAFYAGAGYAASVFSGSQLPNARLANDLALGGAGTIRGFSLRRFAPGFVQDGNGNLLSTYLVQNTGFWNLRGELNMTIAPNVGIAVFYDSGQIYPNLAPDPRHDGVGIGLRYKTPVGPIVIDFAQGLGPDAENLKFYFTVGTL
jgi:outer membrane protein insertion porin family